MQDFYRVVCVRVVDDGKAQTLFRGDENGTSHLRRKMCGRDEIDVVAAARLQFKHHICKAFVRDLVLSLLPVRLRNLVVLAIDAAQVAVAEKDVARAQCSYKRRLFAEVSSVRGDYGEATGIASSYLVIKTIVQAVARADPTALQKFFE